jgi:hypothetical protein
MSKSGDAVFRYAKSNWEEIRKTFGTIGYIAIGESLQPKFSQRKADAIDLVIGEQGEDKYFEILDLALDDPFPRFLSVWTQMPCADNDTNSCSIVRCPETMIDEFEKKTF